MADIHAVYHQVLHRPFEGLEERRGEGLDAVGHVRSRVDGRLESAGESPCNSGGYRGDVGRQAVVSGQIAADAAQGGDVGLRHRLKRKCTGQQQDRQHRVAYVIFHSSSFHNFFFQQDHF